MASADDDDEHQGERHGGAGGTGEADETLEEFHEAAADLLYALILLHLARLLFESRRSGGRTGLGQLTVDTERADVARERREVATTPCSSCSALGLTPFSAVCLPAVPFHRACRNAAITAGWIPAGREARDGVSWTDQALSLLTALAVGLLIGIERGWQSRAAPAGSRVAGVRTFSLLGLAAGVAGQLGQSGFPFAAGALLLSAGAILTAGYVMRMRQDGRPDATSAIAGVAVLALAFLAGTGSRAFGFAGATVITLILALREEAHGFIERLDAADVKALARFSVIAAAVLPFLPSGTYGPYDAWDLRKLWLVVVLVTGFSFLGYVANRIFGARHGTIATAVIGGAYSSTAVTQSLAQRLGSGEGGGAEPAGIALASSVMYFRVLILVGMLATSILPDFALLVAPALVVGLAAAWWLTRTVPRTEGPAPPGNPIALVPALGFVLFLAAAAVAARWAEGRFGEQGIAILIFIMGSLDVDAAIVTAGGLQPNLISPELAALALGGTILANMAVKLGITIAYARRRGRSAAAALAASMAALTVSLTVGGIRLFE